MKKRGPEMSDGRREEREPYLLTGYHLEESGVEYVVLRRPDGSEVAVFSATGTAPGDRGEGPGGFPGAGERLPTGGGRVAD